MSCTTTVTSKPQLRLTTVSPSPRTSSRLIHVDTPNRESLMASTIPSSITNTSSASSIHSTSSVCRSASPHTSTSTHSQPPSPKYADDHFPLIATLNLSQNLPPNVPHSHPAVRYAHHMAQIHNGILRALSSSYNHCLSLRPDTQDASDFLFYNAIIADTLHRHLQVKDLFLITELESLMGTPGALHNNTETNTKPKTTQFPSHHSFKDGLTIYTAYVKTTTAAEYNGLTLRHIIENFAHKLIEYFHKDIAALLSTCIIQDEDAMLETWKKAGVMTSKDSDIHASAPFWLGTHDRGFQIDGLQPDFPGLNWVMETAVRRWYARRHAGAWRYSPCDFSGSRRVMLIGQI